MNSQDILWHDNTKRFQKDAHALFGASNYHWLNYSIDKMIEYRNKEDAKRIGTELHEMAALLIKHKTKLPEVHNTLNMYVNDSILLSLRPEEQLYYSKYFFGTADSIGIYDGILHIHDLKTGKTKASMKQLEIYTAFFLLEYKLQPNDFKDIELRIYQNDEVIVSNPQTDIIVPIMDKIMTVNKIITNMEETDQWTMMN
jgi:hypothetical protein